MARRKGLLHWLKAALSTSPAKRETPHPYGLTHSRVIHQPPTDRPVFAAHERDHHITTSGRRALDRTAFALPPSPTEHRRGIKGRLPIDTIGRARSALARASMMHHDGHLSAAQLATAQRAVHKAWPEIGEHQSTMKPTPTVKLTKTQRAALAAIAEGYASVDGGGDWGAGSKWISGAVMLVTRKGAYRLDTLAALVRTGLVTRSEHNNVRITPAGQAYLADTAGAS